MEHYERFDIDHVRNKLSRMACNVGETPPAGAQTSESYEIYSTEVRRFQAPEFLIKRLGKANTKRRQLFKYLKDHHEKIAKYVDEPIITIPESSQTDNRKPRDYQDEDCRSLALTMHTQTTVTTVHNVPLPLENIEADDCLSDGGQTETSYAASDLEIDDEDRLLVPPPPKVAEPLGDIPFECGFCYYMINPSTTRSWE